MSLKIRAHIGHISSNMTGLCRLKFWPASATTPAISLAWVRKNMGLHRSHQCHTSATTQPYHWPASATSVTYICQNSAISPACVSKNSGLRWPQLQKYHWPVSVKILACAGHISVIHRPQLSHITSLCQQKFWPASAASLTDVIKNTGLHWPHQCHTSATTQPYHWPVSAKILACVGHNSSNITGLRQ